MYVTLRQYAGARERLDEILRRVQDGLVPMLKRQPGFKGYSVIEAEGGEVVSISIFDGKDSALQANGQARDWVAANLRDLLPDPPEVFAGPVIHHALAQEQEQRAGTGRPLHVVIRKLDGVAPEATAMPLARQHTIPAITQSPGFRGFYLVRSDEDPGRVASVTLFDDRESAMRSHEKVVAILRDKMKEAVPHPPRMVSGQTRIMVTG
jgi:heme-degrading monooxygenase HmoA